jgi:TRAP transporter TAXI family solute receptor
MRALILVCLIAAAALPARALTFLSMGTGDIDGGYYAVASAICERVNRTERGRLRCSPETTAGSLYNLAALRSGQIDIAIVQSDWQRHAYEGSSIFAEAGPMPALRSVMALHAEPVTLLARRAAGITGFGDLAGKRVDIGHPSSGRQASMRRIMESFGLTTDDFAAYAELPAGSAIAELCSGRIDATVLIIGHPNAGVARALADCDVVLLPLTGPEIDAFVAGNEDYRRVRIPLPTYPTLSSDIETIAVTATVVTLASADPAAIRVLVTETLSALDQLQEDVPLLAGLTPEAMRQSGLTAPLHPAAAEAFEAWEAAQ